MVGHLCLDKLRPAQVLVKLSPVQGLGELRPHQALVTVHHLEIVQLLVPTEVRKNLVEGRI